MEKWSYKQKMQNCMRIQKEITRNYELVNELFIICMDRGLKLIMENPYSEEHYLRRYWCYPPAVIDMNRQDRGDYFVKPTQYWFLNCEPTYRMLFEVAEFHGMRSSWQIYSKAPGKAMDKAAVEQNMGGGISIKTARSMIHPDYANRFIREFIL